MVDYNILWIEDDADQIYSLVQPLVDSGCKISIAKDYENAKRMNNEFKYDVIILDIIIPSGKKCTTIEEMIALQKEGHFGVKFLEDLPADSPPIVVLTVVNDETISNNILKFPQVVKIIVNKGMIRPSELKKIILNVINKEADENALIKG